ncbi:plasmid replication initiator TrfA [Methylomagnum ishizawai]|uniref:plasmid replication initiator TrfA n=1 Tax=Methylomagnum ishizawai TaxID=1760988 RepID=UPI001C324461|nr:plasmid replication initiator TrfA [Methylomagnum ishizawai]BBL77361.1 hypothetical protein MishRS11D_44590 [Methylomagnum ishizawai]
MADDTSNPSPSRNLQTFLAAEKTEADGKLSLFGRVAVDADRMQGKIPCFHEGMTLDDAVLITGLPREEAARRIQEMRGHDHPGRYAATRLAVGAGEGFLPGQAAPPALRPTETASPTAKVIQFPLPFGDATRAISNPLARCALFAAVNERQYFKEWVCLGEIQGVKIEVKGEQFNQDDHDTLMQLVKMARDKTFGEDITVPVNAVLHGLGRHSHKSQRQQLFREVERIVSSTVRFTPPGLPSYVGHLIEDASTPQDQATLPEHRRRLTYRLNHKFAPFFGEARYTLIDYGERLKLGRNPLVKWLHLWIVSNAEQYPHKVETIRDKCGSQIRELKHFRERLRKAFKVLKETGIITAWHIDTDDLVHIERMPSEAQQKHLARRAGKELRKATAPRAQESPASQTPPTSKPLKPETVEKFRALYPRLDPYACQADFDAWVYSKPIPRSYDAAFLGFAKKWAVGKG